MTAHHSLMLLFLGALMACQDAAHEPMTLVDTGLNADAARDGTDATLDMAGPILDAAMEPIDCGDIGACPPEQRRVGCRCATAMNRICITNADCRPGEDCRPAGENTHYCHYDPPPLRRCPGPTCASDANATQLLVAAVSKTITPLGFETPTPDGLDGSTLSFSPPFTEGQWNDCGLDGLCSDDEGYPGPDEGEGDGRMQGMWLAGFRSSRPAQYCPPERIGCQTSDCCVSRFAHDDLKSQITVIRQRGLTVALVSVDTVGMFHTDIDRIAQAVKGDGVDFVLMASTHNHEAPDTSGQWGPGIDLPVRTGVEPAFMQRIYEQTVNGIREAVAALQPAEMSAGVLDVGTEGLAISDSRAPYIFNDDVPVVHFRSAQGQSIATLLSFGNHAEVLWANNSLITSDYPHYVRHYIREGLPAIEDDNGTQIHPALNGLQGVVTFFAGSVGGLINPGRGGALGYDDQAPASKHSFEAADAVGQRLASHVLRGHRDGLITAIPSDTSPLQFATQRFLVPAENAQLRIAAQAFGLIKRDVYNAADLAGRFLPDLPQIQTQVAAVRLGPVTFFTAPGEVFPETLCGGYPGRRRVRTPIIGDVDHHRVDPICGPDGLPIQGGTLPCIIKPDANNPPDWSTAPEGPYVYERVPGEVPFFIGLAMDALGYIVPDYDFEGPEFGGEAPGDHYEETNSMGPSVMGLWQVHLNAVLDAVRLDP